MWHRDPSCNWTFYATTPGPQSCARYFSSATTNDAVQCDIDVTWLGPWSVHITIPELLHWTVDLQTTRATRLMTHDRWPAVRVGVDQTREPQGVGPDGATRTLGVGDVRLTGRAPNGQCYTIAPKQLWLVADSRAVLRGRDLGPTGPLLRQARLGDFHMPQRGIGMVGSGHFETFDPAGISPPSHSAVFA